MKSFFKYIITTVLNIEARIVLKKYKPFIVTVTGSIGKTSTKDAIYTVLAYAHRADQANGSSSATVRRSEKTLNSDIGLPLSILGCPNAWYSLSGWVENILAGLELIFFKSEYPSILVLEVGADHPGDIRNIAKWLKPDIAVVTKIGAVPVHVEFFPSRQALVDEKLSLPRAVKDGGTVIVLANDEDTAPLHKELATRGVKVLTYGVDTPADFSASHVEVAYGESVEKRREPVGVAFRINHAGNSIPVKLAGVIGVQHVYPAIVAAAVGSVDIHGVDGGILSVVESMSGHVPPPGRMNLLAGTAGSTIIDDTYNSSPDAVFEALAVLRSLIVSPEARKIIVLGDMMELGKFSPEEHRRVGVRIAELFAEGQGGTPCILVAVGQRARLIREGALAGGMMKETVYWYETSIVAASEVKRMLDEGKVSVAGKYGGDVVLVKGSQSSRMERVTAAILADPSRAGELLVRQEAVWLAKK